MNLALADQRVKVCQWCGASFTRTRYSNGHRELVKAWRRRTHCSPSCRMTNVWANRRNDTARLMARTIVNEDGCWVWQGSIKPNGYGQVGWGRGSPRYAHRVFFETFIGPVPEGLVIDHLCRNKRCVNPTHLEPVTNSENLQRWRRSLATA